MVAATATGLRRRKARAAVPAITNPKAARVGSKS